MPTSTKPRKSRTKSEENHVPGRIWTDLTTLHQTCLSQVHAVTTVSPILKDPNFIANAVELSRVNQLAKGLVADIGPFMEALMKIKSNVDEHRACWDDLNSKRKAAWSANDRESAVSFREQQDNLEFVTIQLGEQYQQWNESWSQKVTPQVIELLALIEQTRAVMEKNAHVSE